MVSIQQDMGDSPMVLMASILRYPFEDMKEGEIT